MAKDAPKSKLKEFCDDPEELIKTLMPDPGPDSLKTLIPPPKHAKPAETDGRPEVTWGDVVKLYRNKIEIWIKRSNGSWNMGRIVNMDGERQKLTVEWVDLDHRFGHMAKNISFDTYAEWVKEAPKAPEIPEK